MAHDGAPGSDEEAAARRAKVEALAAIATRAQFMVATTHADPYHRRAAATGGGSFGMRPGEKATQDRIDLFIARWAGSGGAERANFQPGFPG